MVRHTLKTKQQMLQNFESVTIFGDYALKGKFSHCVKNGVFSGPFLPYSARVQENTDQRKLHIWTVFTQCHFLVEIRTSFFMAICLVLKSAMIASLVMASFYNVLCPFQPFLTQF